MIKTDGSARYGIWDKGIYQKTNYPKDKYPITDPHLFPLYDLNGELFNGVVDIEYSNGTRYSGSVKNGLRGGEVN